MSDFYHNRGKLSTSFFRPVSIYFTLFVLFPLLCATSYGHAAKDDGISNGREQKIIIENKIIKAIHVSPLPSGSVQTLVDFTDRDRRYNFPMSPNPARLTIYIPSSRLSDRAAPSKMEKYPAETPSPVAVQAKAPAEPEEKARVVAPVKPIVPAKPEKTETPASTGEAETTTEPLAKTEMPAGPAAKPEKTEKIDLRISLPTRPADSLLSAQNIQEQPLSIDFQGYALQVIQANPSLQADREEYRRSTIAFLSQLQAYDFRLDLVNFSNVYNFNAGTEYGTDLRLDLGKNLYDGGRKQVLEREWEIVKALSRANLMDRQSNVLLSAANHYATLFNVQEEMDFLRRHIAQYRIFIDTVEKVYSQGLRVSAYDYYTSRNELLVLEKNLVDKKAEYVKIEATFRQFGRIYAQQPLKLVPLNIYFPIDPDGLQKEAIAKNSSLQAAQLRKELQVKRIEESKAAQGLSVSIRASLGAQAGSSGVISPENRAFGEGTRPIANIGITASLPLYDGGERTSRVMMEEVEALKQKLALQNATEEVIRNINNIYADYKNLETDLEISGELRELNQKRLNIARERFEKGLEEYRAVRESWNDLIVTEGQIIRQATFMQKFLIDLAILSGRRIIDSWPAK